jgi:replicative DNA helicase
MNEQIPPQNIEAEESVLMTVLTNDAPIVYDLLAPEDFYREAHQIIFRRAGEMKDAGKKPDLLTVKDSLESSGEIEKIGGRRYLVYLMEQPYPVNVEHYCAIIRDKANLRRLMKESHDIYQSVWSGEEVPVVIDKAQQRILSIDSVSPGNAYCDLKSRLMPSVKRWQDAKESGSGLGIMSGYHEIYQITGGFQPGDLIILAGRPSMGKTAFALNLAVNISSRGVPGAFFSLEMSKEQVEDRLASIATKINLKKFITGQFSTENWERIIKTLENMKKWQFFYDDSGGSSYHQIRQKARRLKHKHKIQYAIVDYLQLMDGDKDGNREREVASITRAMKLTAKELGIPIILLSQLNRSLENRNNKRPTLADLRESGAIEQDADVVMFIYRDEVYNENSPEKGIAEINIAKQRNGPTGTVKIAWIDKTTRFENLAYGNEIEDRRAG